MTKARSLLISLADTPWYHLMSRCVRRAFLCGEDRVSGKDFNYRRYWVQAIARRLAGVYAVDIAAFAVMSNHYHLVVRVDSRRARSWSEREVLRRWMKLCSVPPHVQHYVAALQAGENPQLDSMTQAKVCEQIEIYRARLEDVSWYMRVLNATISNQANHEDNARGRFWEGRFKSQALLDERAILAAMIYVDLNPIRAAMAETLEESACTSIHERIKALRGETVAGVDLGALRYLQHFAVLPEQPLMPFDVYCRRGASVPFDLYDYLELAEATGRCQHPHKRGKIPDNAPKLLEKMQLDPQQFVETSSNLMYLFGNAVGSPEKLEDYKNVRNNKYARGITAARRMG